MHFLSDKHFGTAIHSFEYDPETDRRFIYDIVYMPKETPSHRRSHVDRSQQSADAKRAMVRRALGFDT